jgi:hypothetical protein
MWRRLRIAVLLVILLFVAANTYFDRVYSTDWNIPLRVAAFPINADGSTVTASYIGQQPADSFQRIETFFEQEAKHYGLQMERPIRLTLAPPLSEAPPELEPGGGAFSAVLWSLRIRYWAWRVAAPPGAAPDIKLFVLYHDPRSRWRCRIRWACRKARSESCTYSRMPAERLERHRHRARAAAYARRNRQIRSRRSAGCQSAARAALPQSFAELMAGRIPVSNTEAETPHSLQQVLIGPKTASEIGWKKR